MKKVTFVVALSIAAAALVLFVSSCGPTMLRPGEVNEYQGQKLSAVDDFRENSIKGPQQIDIQTYRLQVTGLVKSPQSYTYNEVINRHRHYKKVVDLNCVEGWSVNILWEGLLVKELIEEAGPLPEAKIAIFHAYDGYTSSLPIDYLVSQNILIAYKMNEITIPPERGFPFHLVAESKFGYKWVKWLTEIELSDNTSYRGYWESRGYTNSADLDELMGR